MAIKKKISNLKVRDNFLHDIFIGLYVEVIESKNKTYKGIYGKIIDETKNTFLIDEGNNIKMVPKDICKFLFYYNGYYIVVDGKLINKRIWDRMKIRIRKIL